MAIKWAVQNGGWSNPNTWNDGTKPQPGDDVFADGRTVTIDENIDVTTIRTTQRSGGTAGGGFRPIHNTILTTGVIAGTTSCVTFPSGAPNFFTLVGTVTASASIGINNSSTGTANLVGDAYSDSTGRAINNNGTFNMLGSLITFGGNFGALLTNTNVFNMTGDIVLRNEEYINFTHVTNSGIATIIGNINTGTRTVGFDTFNGGGVFISNTGQLFIYGNVGRAWARFSITITSSYYVYVSGNVFGATGISNTNGTINNTGVVDVVGKVFGGNLGNVRGGGIGNFGTTGIINITGDVVGGFATVGIGNQGSSSVVNIKGRAIGRTAVGVNNSSTGIVNVTLVVGGSGGPTEPTVGNAAGIINSQNGLVFVEQVEFGAQGAVPISGPVFLTPTDGNLFTMRRPSFPDFTPVTFFNSFDIEGIFPAEGDVRKGIVYGLGDFTGTMAVPSLSAVQFDVPIDDTVGALFLRPENFWEIQRSAITNPTTIGYRLKNVATIGAAGQLLGSFNVEGLSGYNLP